MVLLIRKLLHIFTTVIQLVVMPANIPRVK